MPNARYRTLPRAGSRTRPGRESREHGISTGWSEGSDMDVEPALPSQNRTPAFLLLFLDYGLLVPPLDSVSPILYIGVWPGSGFWWRIRDHPPGSHVECPVAG